MSVDFIFTKTLCHACHAVTLVTLW